MKKFCFVLLVLLSASIAMAQGKKTSIGGSGTANQVAIFTDSNTITSSTALTLVNGKLVASVDTVNTATVNATAVNSQYFRSVATYKTGQDVPQPPIQVNGVWNAERSGDWYVADFENHCVGAFQAACHGLYLSTWSDSWDAYAIDARVESGPDAIQSYGAQFTVINNNPTVGPDAAATTGVRVSIRGNAASSVGVAISGAETAISAPNGKVTIGDLKQPAGIVKPVCVDGTGTLVVCP